LCDLRHAAIETDHGNPSSPIGAFEMSSAMAILLASSVLLFWLVWVLIDPHAPDALALLLQDLRLRVDDPFPSDTRKNAHAWGKLGFSFWPS
jgi:hypothetical protein